MDRLPEETDRSGAYVGIAGALLLFLAPGRRRGQVRIGCDGTSSLGHVVEELGVPLTEVGSLVVNGRPAAPGYRPRDGDVVHVTAVRRSQPIPSPRFVLDVHLGTVARRLRLAGVDTAYANDRDDDALIEQADVEPSLRPGTRRTYQTFSRCADCGRVYWRGAHSKRLDLIVESAGQAAGG